MKAMLTGFSAVILISVGAYFALGEMGFSSEDRFTSDAVRLE